MSEQGGDTRIELMFRLEAALKRIEALEAALREIANLINKKDDATLAIVIARAALDKDAGK